MRLSKIFSIFSRNKMRGFPRARVIIATGVRESKKTPTAPRNRFLHMDFIVPFDSWYKHEIKWRRDGRKRR